jgi:hypothetical protein
MYFNVGNNKAGEPSWWLYGSNNEMVAWAGEAFYSHSNAHRAASDFKVGLAVLATRFIRMQELAGGGALGAQATRLRRPASLSMTVAMPKRPLRMSRQRRSASPPIANKLLIGSCTGAKHSQYRWCSGTIGAAVRTRFG